MFGVFQKGGAIGENTKNPIKTFSDRNEAKAYAKQMRSTLTPGERSYYKLSYVTKEMHSELKKMHILVDILDT